jgi:thioredoxin-like negative regulator of GroEL
MKIPIEFMQTDQMPEDEFTAEVHQATQPLPDLLPINDAIQIKAAEYWLKLGEADEALRELEALPSRSWKCDWALTTRIAAIGMLRERSEVTVQE